MADLTSWQWERWAPDFGDNRKLERPFCFLIRSGLSKTELLSWVQDFFGAVQRHGRPRVKVTGKDGKETEKYADESAEERDTRVALQRKGVAEVLEKVVKFGDEPLRVDGAPVTTVEGYVALMTNLATGEGHLLAILDAVRHFNSVEGSRALFFERLSGGMASTRGASTERAVH